MLCIATTITFFNYYINNAIISIINKNPNRTYNLENKEINISIINQSINFNDINVRQINAKNSANSILNANVKEIRIEGFSLYYLLIKKKIIAKKLHIINPSIKIISAKTEKKVVQNSKSINLFWKDIINNSMIKNIFIENGQLETTKNDKIGFSSKNINIKLKNVSLNQNKINNPLPFLYSNIELEIGETYSKINELYHAKILDFKASNSFLSLKNITIKPILNLKDFNKKIKTEKDYTEVNINQIDLQNTQWNFVNDSVYIKASNMIIHNSETILHRNKYVRDDTSKKYLYSKIIRELPFYITIDSFKVNSGELAYKELQKNKKNYGEINFKNIFITGKNINNYNYQNDSLKTHINFKALLFGKSKIYADYSFSTKNTLDKYILKGKLKNFNTSDLNILTKPMFNLKTTGNIKELKFLINGSDYDASASVNMVYKDLKLIYGNNKGKNKLISKIANLILKNDRDYKDAKNVHVYTIRDQEKSMYNQIIKCFIESLKITVI